MGFESGRMIAAADMRLPATFLLHDGYVAVQYGRTWWGKPRAKAQSGS
jgi:hypothetical protein